MQVGKKARFTALHFFLFCAFSLGIAISRFIPQYTVYLVGFIASSIAIFLFIRKGKSFSSDMSLLVIFFMLGGLWYISDKAGRSLDEFLGKQNFITFKVISLPQ